MPVDDEIANRRALRRSDEHAEKFIAGADRSALGRLGRADRLDPPREPPGAIGEVRIILAAQPHGRCDRAPPRLAGGEIAVAVALRGRAVRGDQEIERPFGFFGRNLRRNRRWLRRKRHGVIKNRIVLRERRCRQSCGQRNKPCARKAESHRQRPKTISARPR